MHKHVGGLLVAAAIAIGGCTSSSDETASPAEKAAATKVDTQRANELKRYYDLLAADDPVYGSYSVEQVTVDGGDVTVDTSLFPDEEGRPFFTGACTQLMSLEPWIESIRVRGQDDAVHARWAEGDNACSITGL